MGGPSVHPTVHTSRPNAGARRSSVVSARATPAADPEIIHHVDSRAELDALFSRGPSVTAGAPTEAKFLIDRDDGSIYFIPPKYKFHVEFYHEVLNGPLDDDEFDRHAYNRPDRDFIPGTVTAYDSYLDPVTNKKGAICYSYWPTDHFDPKLLKETHEAVQKALGFLGPDERLFFRAGGPIQERILERDAGPIAAAGIDVKTNLEISKGLKYMTLSEGEAKGRLRMIEKGAAMPRLDRSDVALFLGDVPPTAPPVAAIFTTQVQTYNSHLGIVYRQEDTPYFYKSYTDQELEALRALDGQFVSVKTTEKDSTVDPTTEAEAEKYLDEIKPKDAVKLKPNLDENRARPYSELVAMSVGPDGKWNQATLAAYGRKVMGAVQLAHLYETGQLAVSEPEEPEVVAPVEPFGIPANWYTRFMRTARDENGQTFSTRIAELRTDPRFRDKNFKDWKADELEKLRDAISNAKMPDELLNDIHDQVAVPYLETHPDADSVRIRSSVPVVEDGNAGAKLPNMAGAFDSHTADWNLRGSATAIAKRATREIAETLQEVYASVWNDRAVSELEWHNVELVEDQLAMAVLVMPNEEKEKANGVLRVNEDLAGFFSITGETQFGENLVTNPEGGASPDTWIDGNYDILNGEVRQDIEYERLSNLVPDNPDPTREHALTDAEIHAAYKAMQVINTHFAKLEGKPAKTYQDECEIKITSAAKLQFKQERAWVE